LEVSVGHIKQTITKKIFTRGKTAMTPLNNSCYSFYRTMIIGLQTELCRNLVISQYLHIMGGGGGVGVRVGRVYMGSNDPLFSSQFQVLGLLDFNRSLPSWIWKTPSWHYQLAFKMTTLLFIVMKVGNLWAFLGLTGH